MLFMAERIHIYPKIGRRLRTLEKQTSAPAAPAIAAARARQIIDALIQGSPPASAGLLGPKTDKRVKNCLKFNLGSGFRLICIKEKKIISVMFVGDHDQCHAWLDQYKKIPSHKSGLNMEIITVAEPVPSAPKPMAFDSQSLCLDDPFSHDISQADLRQVFKGLTR